MFHHFRNRRAMHPIYGGSASGVPWEGVQALELGVNAHSGSL